MGKSNSPGPVPRRPHCVSNRAGGPPGSPPGAALGAQATMRASQKYRRQDSEGVSRGLARYELMEVALPRSMGPMPSLAFG